jgi:hypothetical protein
MLGANGRADEVSVPRIDQDLEMAVVVQESPIERDLILEEIFHRPIIEDRIAAVRPFDRCADMQSLLDRGKVQIL